MEQNRERRLAVTDEITTSKLHIAGDARHLRKICLRLVRTQQVIESGMAAFRSSRELLLRVENTTATRTSNLTCE
jgi:hypothetical protein